MNNDDALKAALLSALTGGGVYAAARGIKDLVNIPKPPPKNNEVIDIPLPASRFQKQAESSVWDTWLKPTLATAGGGTAGFLGASKLYEATRNYQLKKQMEAEEKRYMDTLQQVHQKVASMSTPNVDSFIDSLFSSLGEEIEKTGFFDEFVDPEFVEQQGLTDVAGKKGKDLLESAWNSDLAKFLTAGTILTGLGTAGATYGIAKKMDAFNRKTQEEQTYPTRVNAHAQ